MTRETMDVEITRVGAQGDGVANTAAGPVFIPFTLPGERVVAHGTGERARLKKILFESADRIAPVCQHFTVCGGCAVQHMSSEFYGAWKRDSVLAAFKSRAIDAEVAPLFVPQGLRRRAVLTAIRNDAVVELGFHQAQSHDLVDLIECPVLHPRIVAALPELRTLLKPLLAKRSEARVTVTMTEAGLDIAIGKLEKLLTLPLRSELAKHAADIKIARVSVDDDPVYTALPPFLRFGTIDVHVPPGAFIQAVAAAETEMARLVVEGIGKSKKVADLFAGVGAFSFPVAARAKVLAVDSDKAAIAALADGVRMGSGIKPVTTVVRDLFREPLSALELNEHDAVVFDPPRAGAEAQSKMIAKSKVKTVVAISCNPATLARDARILIDGGYAMGRVTPIDQFHYTPHIECVTVFKR